MQNEELAAQRQDTMQKHQQETLPTSNLKHPKANYLPEPAGLSSLCSLWSWVVPSKTAKGHFYLF